MRHILVVTVAPNIFNAYWYGTGEVIEQTPVDASRFLYRVDYGTDEYRARYQADRFASGLYFASVEAVGGER